MAEDTKKGMLSKSEPMHDGHGHGAHHGMHIKKHEGGGYHVHKFHPDGREEEAAVGTGDDQQDMEAVHDHMHQHFAEEQQEVASPQPEPQSEGAGGAPTGMTQ